MTAPIQANPRELSNRRSGPPCRLAPFLSMRALPTRLVWREDVHTRGRLLIPTFSADQA
jgi:hypothetical protein